MIIHTSDMLTARCQDMLDKNLEERGGFQLNLQPCHIMTTIKRTITILSYYAQAKQLQIVFEVITEQFGARSLLTDERRITQILVNLISNACKFSDPGEQVKVNLQLEDLPCE